MVGEHLKYARRSRNLTQEEVAHRAGVDRSYLSQIENNRKSPTIDVFVAVCQAIGVRASEVMAALEAGGAGR